MIERAQFFNLATKRAKLTPLSISEDCPGSRAGVGRVKDVQLVVQWSIRLGLAGDHGEWDCSIWTGNQIVNKT